MKNKEEFLRAFKFFLFSCSAGAIQLLLDMLLHDVIGGVPKWASYLTGLVASVVWNFTFNRKFTFKSATNVPIAMTKVFLYYLVFTPLSLVLAAYLYDGNILNVWTINTLFSEETIINYSGLFSLISTLICMIINLVTEFLYQRFFVFGKSIDTNVNDKNNKEKNMEDENVKH